MSARLIPIVAGEPAPQTSARALPTVAGRKNASSSSCIPALISLVRTWTMEWILAVTSVSWQQQMGTQMGLAKPIVNQLNKTTTTIKQGDSNGDSAERYHLRRPHRSTPPARYTPPPQRENTNGVVSSINKRQAVPCSKKKAKHTKKKRKKQKHGQNKRKTKKIF